MKVLIFILIFSAIVSLLTWCVMIAHIVYNRKFMKRLIDLSLSPIAESPKVSVIITARNEEKKIEAGLRSILAQDYKNVEIVVINDRSTDGTEAILTRMKQSYPELHIFNITELPGGWLGKCHAMYFGTQKATGEYYLFTDADVNMEKNAISSAMNYVVKQQLDHFTLMPKIITPTIFLAMVNLGVSLGVLVIAQPLKAKDLASDKAVGFGPFNLLRADVCHQAEILKAIAMETVEDMKLGQAVKKQGFKTDCLLGYGLVSYEWYSSLKEMADGLVKNSFPMFGYRLYMVVLSTINYLMIYILPFTLLAMTSNWLKLLGLLNLLFMFITYWQLARFNRVNPWYALGGLFSGSFLQYIALKSTIKILLNDGLSWKDTHYTLKELKTHNGLTEIKKL